MPDFKPGQLVMLNDGRRAIVRFAGPTHFQVGEWIGVELEEKTGKNDGSVQGERYFDCPMGYGMFVKPVMASLYVAPAASSAKPAVGAGAGGLMTASTTASTTTRKPGGRPSGFQGRPSSSIDAGMGRRMSMNAPSPTPGPKPPTPRPSSVVRSRSRSPSKPLLSGPSSGNASRTMTPSNVRAPSAQSRSRPSGSSSRASTGGAQLPANRMRQVSAASGTPRPGPGHASTKSVSSRGPMGGPRALVRQEDNRRPSVSSLGGHDFGVGAANALSSTTNRDDESPSPPVLSEDEILSPQPTSPVVGRANVLEKLAVVSSSRGSATPPPKKATPPITSRPLAASAANRENEDLKAKLKVLERKRVEDRDKLKQLEKVQGERDKFEGIIQKLQLKYQPLQQENSDLRKSLKEAETRFESVEALQADHDSALELATLDREMAEETAEVLKMELEALNEKAEELQLEVEVLREENSEFSSGMSPEERASSGWLQMERTNERLREALIRLRDLTQEQEQTLREQIGGLEEDLKEFNGLKREHATVKEKLSKSEAAVEDFRQQLDTALGAEEMIEDLTERNMKLAEQVEEFKAVVEDLESLKEINDELEINHVQNEKEMQEELDFKDTIISEQVRRAGQQEVSLSNMEYTLSRYRELVTSLQSDLEDMRASQAVTEGESEKLNDRSRAMMDLNMKLQISASKAQVKAIDLELRRLEAQEAEQHLDIVRLFLPDSYSEDQDSVLAFLRFRRLSFKAKLLSGFLREKVNGQATAGHEDDIIYGCDAIDKLVWVSAMCERFVNDIGHCSMEQFSRYQHALLELEPVERALNGWIDGLRRDELKEHRCAEELQRTMSLMTHLSEVHISDEVAAFADEAHMKALAMQSHLESATVALGVARGLVQQRVMAEGEEAKELAQHFAKRMELAMTQTRSTKVVAGRAVRSLEDLKTRSLSLSPETRFAFEACERATRELASLARAMGHGIHGLLNQDEGRTEAFTHGEVCEAVQRAVVQTTASAESDLFSAYLKRLRDASAQIVDLAAVAGDLEQAQEFEVNTAPWLLRAQELKTLKKMPVDMEEELRRVKSEHVEARRSIAQRDEQLSTAVLKIETLESRMRDAQANTERIVRLQGEVGEMNGYVASLREDIEKQDRELKTLEAERDKWKKVASDSRAYAADAGGEGLSGDETRAGQERAVATAREMDALRRDVESLQAAVRYLREDNRRARVAEQQQDHGWLAEPLVRRSAGAEEQRRQLVVTEGRDVLGELVRLASTATVFDLGAMTGTTTSRDRLAWRPVRTTPQYHAARQAEDLEAWREWHGSVLKKTEMLRVQQQQQRRRPAARLSIRLPRLDAPGKTRAGGVRIVGAGEWEALQMK